MLEPDSLILFYLQLAAIFFVICFPFFLLWLNHWVRPLSIPGPSLCDYFPSGLINPIYRDPTKTTDTFLAMHRVLGDVYQARLGPQLCVLTAVPEDISHIVSDGSSFIRAKAMTESLGVVSPQGVLCSTGERRRHLRLKIRDRFSIDLLHNLIPDICGVIRYCSDSIQQEIDATPEGEASNVIDLSPFFQYISFCVIINVAFGFKMSREQSKQLVGDVDELCSEMMEEMMSYPMRRYLAFTGCRKRFLELTDKFHTKCEYFLKQRLEENKQGNRSRRQDVMDAILEMNLEPKAIISLIAEFVVGGTHTTRSVLNWCILEMCKDESVMKRAEAEVHNQLSERPLSMAITVEDMKQMPYITNIWKESLRVYGISSGLLRETTKDIVLKGSSTFVPKGSRVMASTLRASTHEKTWPDAMQFDPDRFGRDGQSRERVPVGAYIPFGAGMYSCTGRLLADIEGPLVLAELLRRFRFSLACRVEDIVRCSRLTDNPQTMNDGSDMKGMSLPVQVRNV